jgi:hypothetical protein
MAEAPAEVIRKLFAASRLASKLITCLPDLFAKRKSKDWQKQKPKFQDFQNIELSMDQKLMDFEILKSSLKSKLRDFRILQLVSNKSFRIYES